MTTFQELDVRCAVCGEPARVVELTSTSSFGPPDLDLRPQGPARWALSLGVQRCGSCGYCAAELGKALPGAAEVVRSALFAEARVRTELKPPARDWFCEGLTRATARRRLSRSATDDARDRPPTAHGVKLMPG